MQGDAHGKDIFQPYSHIRLTGSLKVGLGKISGVLIPGPFFRSLWMRWSTTVHRSSRVARLCGHMGHALELWKPARILDCEKSYQEYRLARALSGGGGG